MLLENDGPTKADENLKADDPRRANNAQQHPFWGRDMELGHRGFQSDGSDFALRRWSLNCSKQAVLRLLDHIHS